MPISLKKLFTPVQLSTSLTGIYTLSESTNAVLDNLTVRVVNTTGSAAAVSGNVVPDGGSASNSNNIATAVTVPANDYIFLTIPVMKNADQLRLLSDTATALTVHHESGLPKLP